MVLKPGREAEAEKIFRKWELDFAVIGEVTDTGRMQLVWNGETVCNIPLGPLADEAPNMTGRISAARITRPGPGQAARGRARRHRHRRRPLEADGLPNLASRRWIWEQYDSQVGADTIQRPGGDAAVVRVHGTKSAGDHHRLHPALLLRRPIGREAGHRRAYRNLCAVGAKPLAVATASTSAIPSGPRSWRSSSAASKAWATPAAPSTSRSSAATCQLYNESKATGVAAPSCQHRRSAASGCWRVGKSRRRFRLEGKTKRWLSSVIPRVGWPSHCGNVEVCHGRRDGMPPAGFGSRAPPRHTRSRPDCPERGDGRP